MERDTKENSNSCSGGCCGCHIDAYATNRECPHCGKKLRLTGRAQLFEFRLSCAACGYAGPLLAPAEVGELI
jgi:predicted RNA-binding Zn-ribbon protein involved in translation (DUF1610 family)